MRYTVETFARRATIHTLSQRCYSLREATKVFMREAWLCRGDRDATVLLTRPHADRPGADVLAHKSTDSDRAIFEPAYFGERGQ